MLILAQGLVIIYRRGGGGGGGGGEMGGRRILGVSQWSLADSPSPHEAL